MDNMPGMPGMRSPPSPPPPSRTSDAAAGAHHTHDSTSSMVMSHMTFFWGKDSEILFSDWPGTRTGMYVLALIVVFVLSFVVELLSSYQWRGREGRARFWDSTIRTIVHGIRMGLAYLVMLAIMSFNVGVLIVAIAGHILGFFLFGSGILQKPDAAEKDFRSRGNC